MPSTIFETLLQWFASTFLETSIGLKTSAFWVRGLPRREDSKSSPPAHLQHPLQHPSTHRTCQHSRWFLVTGRSITFGWICRQLEKVDTTININNAVLPSTGLAVCTDLLPLYHISTQVQNSKTLMTILVLSQSTTLQPCSWEMPSLCNAWTIPPSWEHWVSQGKSISCHGDYVTVCLRI